MMTSAIKISVALLILPSFKHVSLLNFNLLTPLTPMIHLLSQQQPDLSKKIAELWQVAGCDIQDVMYDQVMYD